MVFFHRMREGRVVLKASTFDHIKVEGEEGYRRIPKWGKTASFEGIPDYRYKGRTWRGTKDLKGEMAALLMSHPRYGKDFIAFSEDGGDAELVESFFEAKESGTVYCWLTDRDFVNAQGAAGHRDSKQFKEAVEEYLANARLAFAR